MTYFSRLTDIVTCSLSRLLDETADPNSAIQGIIAEMEEGLAGAQRSVTTAANNERRLADEIGEHRKQVDYWNAKAREAVLASDEGQARVALLRRSEIDDLIAGLRQQHEAAVATREHLTTMQRALEARLAEAYRRRAELHAPSEPTPTAATLPDAEQSRPVEQSRSSRIEAELEALKRNLQSGD